MTSQMESRDVIASGQITALLEKWNDDDPEILSQLMTLVYEPLRAIASNQLRRESPGHTLDTGALVHETYLRLSQQGKIVWRDRQHFYRITARIVRRVLIDHARRRLSFKRGGDLYRVEFDVLSGLPEQRDSQLLALDEALRELKRLDPPLAQVVEWRFFAGLSTEEIAELQGQSERTVSRRWRAARAWLGNFLGGEAS